MIAHITINGDPGLLDTETLKVCRLPEGWSGIDGPKIQAVLKDSQSEQHHELKWRRLFSGEKIVIHPR